MLGVIDALDNNNKHNGDESPILKVWLEDLPWQRMKQFTSCSWRIEDTKDWALNLIRKSEAQKLEFSSLTSELNYSALMRKDETWDRNISASTLKVFEISDSTEPFGPVKVAYSSPSKAGPPNLP